MCDIAFSTLLAQDRREDEELAHRLHYISGPNHRPSMPPPDIQRPVHASGVGALRNTLIHSKQGHARLITHHDEVAEFSPPKSTSKRPPPVLERSPNVQHTPAYDSRCQRAIGIPIYDSSQDSYCRRFFASSKLWLPESAANGCVTRPQSAASSDRGVTSSPSRSTRPQSAASSDRSLPRSPSHSIRPKSAASSDRGLVHSPLWTRINRPKARLATSVSASALGLDPHVPVLSPGNTARTLYFSPSTTVVGPVSPLLTRAPPRQPSVRHRPRSPQPHPLLYGTPPSWRSAPTPPTSTSRVAGLHQVQYEPLGDSDRPASASSRPRSPPVKRLSDGSPSRAGPVLRRLGWVEKS